MPFGVVKNWSAHKWLVTVDAMYLRGIEKSMLIIDTCYDRNQKNTMLAFSVVRTKDATSWARFLESIFSDIQGMRAIMSDGTKRIVDIGVQMKLQSRT